MSFKKRLYCYLNRDVFAKTILRGARYRTYSTTEEIKSFQVKRFNEVWQDAFNNLPFYSEWKEKNNLPGKISSLAELAKWPIVTKRDLQINVNSLLRADVKPTGYIMTGGSTGEPLHLPTWKDIDTSPSMWLGRGDYGSLPGDKTFLLWGHHHLYGKGFKRSINIFVRILKDYASNIKRVSSYDISESEMKKAFIKYLNFKPEFVIGFSPSILSFVRMNKKNQNKLNQYPKAVVCTAGPLSSEEMKEIEAFFNAPVCMEYGSAECGVMAYTVPNINEYVVFWDTHLLQGIKDELGEVKNIVTRLTSCYFPLIRYDIGDYLVLNNNIDLHSIQRIKSIIGRPSDIVIIENGPRFFGALIGDCVKQVESIIANQLHVYKDGLRIEIVALKILTESDFTLIKNRLITVVPGLENHKIIINQVDKLYNTVSGKSPLVVRHESNLLD